MHQLIVAALTILCATSISGVNWASRQLPLADTAATGEPPMLPPVSAAVSAAPTVGLESTLPGVAPEPQLQPAVAEILAYLDERHTRLSRRDLVALAGTIVEQAELHQLDPSLVLAVIKVESGCYNLAVSHVGALGLMQLMPPTGEELAGKLGLPWSGEETLFDPIINVKLGTAYLKQLSDRYDGNVRVALAAYNWGPGRIDRFLRRGSPVPKEYAQRVMQSYQVTRRAS